MDEAIDAPAELTNRQEPRTMMERSHTIEATSGGASESKDLDDANHSVRELPAAKEIDAGPHVLPRPKASRLHPHSHNFQYGGRLRSMLGVTAEAATSSIGVAYRDVNVYGYGSQTDYQKTFANYPLAYLGRLGVLWGRQWRRTRIDILRDMEGLVRSGEMLVVLGRPASGCSTLLKTMAGQTYGFHVDGQSKFDYQGRRQSQGRMV